MHPEFERGVAEQNRLLREMVALDRDATDFDQQFDKVASQLIAVTNEVERLMRSDPQIRRALAL
jgi:hypothetical protein